MHDSYDTSTYIEPTNCKTNDCFNSLISIYLWARVLKYLNIGTMALPHRVSVNKCKLYAIPHTCSEVFSTRNQTEQWRHFNYVPQLKDALIIIIYIIFLITCWKFTSDFRLHGDRGAGYVLIPSVCDCRRLVSPRTSSTLGIFPLSIPWSGLFLSISASQKETTAAKHNWFLGQTQDKKNYRSLAIFKNHSWLRRFLPTRRFGIEFVSILSSWSDFELRSLFL